MRFKTRIFILVLSLVFILSACSSPEVTNENSSSSSYPMTITHAYGETVINTQPERIVTLAWSNQDSVLALGIVPVGTSAANWGSVGENGLLPWTYNEYISLGEDNPNVFFDTDGFDYEAIAESTPDIIVAPYSGITQEEYDLLSQIAPVIPYKENAWMTVWKQQFIETAIPLGYESKAKEILKETESIIEEIKSTYSELAGLKTALFWVNPADLSSFYIYTPTDPRGAFLLDLGFVYPESYLALDDGSSFAISVSAEQIELLNDIDLMIAYGDQSTLDAMKADAIFSQVDVVKENKVVLLESNSDLAAALNPSILTIKAGLAEEYMAKIYEVYKR